VYIYIYIYIYIVPFFCSPSSFLSRSCCESLACEAFNDEKKRATLFLDYFKGEENLEKVMVLHKRRILKQKLAKATYRPKTMDQLEVRFPEKAYRDLIVDECKKRSRVQKDTLCPSDEKRLKYWILDDESFEVSSLQELEMILESQAEVSQDDALKLSADGGFFSAGGDISTGGIGVQDGRHLMDLHSQAPTGQGGKQVKSQAQLEKEKLEKDKAKKDKEAQAAQVAAAETSLTKAKKATTELAKKVGEGSKLLLELKRADASPALMTQISESIDKMKNLHEALEERIILAIENPPDYYNAMNENARMQIEYYNNRTLYGKALINTSKRVEKLAVTAAAAAAAKEADTNSVA